MTLQLTRRVYRGIQWDLAYTLAKSEDNAPITSTLSVQGDTGGRSDPGRPRYRPGAEHPRPASHLRRQHRGAAAGRRRRASPGAILNNNQFGVALQFASGIPVTLRSNRELNNDGIGSDRPVGVTRNCYRLPRARTSTCATRGCSRWWAPPSWSSSPR